MTFGGDLAIGTFGIQPGEVYRMNYTLNMSNATDMSTNVLMKTFPQNNATAETATSLFNVFVPANEITSVSVSGLLRHSDAIAGQNLIGGFTFSTFPSAVAFTGVTAQRIV